MPELPDLEVFSKNLDKEFSGKTLKQIKVKVDSKLNVPVKELQKHLQSQQLKKIYREGKELYFEFANKDILSLQLILSGSFFIISFSAFFNTDLMDFASPVTLLAGILLLVEKGDMPAFHKISSA